MAGFQTLVTHFIQPIEIEFGDTPGHPFHGNQHVDVGSDGEKTPKEKDPVDRQAAWVDKISEKSEVINAKGVVLARMDPEILERSARVMVEFEKQAPHMASMTEITYGQLSDMKPGEIAGTVNIEPPGSVQIDWAPLTGESAQFTTDALENAFQSGGLSSNSIEGTVWHELGHAAVDHLANDGMLPGGGHWEKFPGSGDTERFVHTAAEQLTLCQTTADVTGKDMREYSDRKDIALQLSHYAASNPRELVAEAYSAYKTMDRPGKIANSLGSWLDGKIADYEEAHAVTATAALMQPMEIEFG